MSKQIHCDLSGIYGPAWSEATDDQIDCLVKKIKTVELFGKTPDMYGFVGVQVIDRIVGGYFALQYEKDDIYYKKNKELSTRHTTPFARVFFLFFAGTGRLLLQNTKFVGLPLSMYRARNRFKRALNRVLDDCGMHKVVSISMAPDTTPDQDFIEEFERSSRVVKLMVTDIAPEAIPEDFVYYNPQRERNNIIRDSHRHDYSHLKSVELEAKKNGDLKRTHLRDLIRAAQPKVMIYHIHGEEFVMRREAPRKFQYTVDMDVEQLPKDQMQAIIENLRRERGVYIDSPSDSEPEPEPVRPSSEGQLTIFDLGGVDDDMD
jgi:hypothetical protein